MARESRGPSKAVLFDTGEEDTMTARILAALFVATLLSGCGVSGIMYTAAKNGCSVSDQAKAEQAALEAGRPVTSASCHDLASAERK